MNAYKKGMIHGSLEFPKWKKVSILTFQSLGEYVAHEKYKYDRSRRAYLSGWMTNYDRQYQLGK